MCIALSLLLLAIFLVDAAFVTPIALSFARDPFGTLPDEFIPLFISMMSLTAYGPVYTILLVWDIRGAGVRGAWIAALGSGLLVALVAGWLTWAAIHGGRYY